MTSFDASRNLLLAMLPRETLDALGDRLETIAFSAGAVLYDANERVDHVYFPLDLVVSLDQIVTDDSTRTGATPAVALIGREGVVGVEAFLGGATWVSRATVRIGGQAIRVAASALCEELMRSGELRRLLLGSADALYTQVAAGAACERVHTVQQRLVRWLLCFDDRVAPDDIGVTQETFARLLGVRRVSVLEAAGALNDAGLVASRRGGIALVDRPRLLALSCSCYQLIRARYESYLNAR